MRLARLLGIHTATRSVIVHALWQYIKTNKLQVHPTQEYREPLLSFRTRMIESGSTWTSTCAKFSTQKRSASPTFPVDCTLFFRLPTRLPFTTKSAAIRTNRQETRRLVTTSRLKLTIRFVKSSPISFATLLQR